MAKTNNLLIHTWTAYKCGENYYLPYMHWVYLNEIVKYFDEINLIVPVGKIKSAGELIQMEFGNVNIIEVPFYSNYLGALKTFFHYVYGYAKLRDCQVFYSRYPAPFGWLQKVFFSKKTRIIHYVGDPIDAAINNPNFSTFKKNMFLAMFKPENWMFEWACIGAKVYTNGFHIAKRLKRKNIQAEPLISSTLRDDDFYFSENMNDLKAPKLIYVGYLRTAKGVEIVIDAFKKLLDDFSNASLTIVGSGEFENQLIRKVKDYEISDQVDFRGFIDDRKKINELLRNHDIFCFASLSEGSPRVILEAMANGLNVISTPVGSLPHMFKDKENIIFAKFNDAEDFYKKLIYLITNKDEMIDIRKRAYNKVKNYTIKNFIKSIFINEKEDSQLPPMEKRRN